MDEINEIKLPKGVDRIAVKQHEDKIVIEFIPEAAKFKEGDFVYEDGRIMIVKNYPNIYHASLCYLYSNKPIYDGSYGFDFSEPTFRYATEGEKQLLIDALKKDGRRWNAEKLKIEDMPQPKFKIGDKVRFKKGGYIGTSMYDEVPLTVSGYCNQRQNILDCKGFPYFFHEDWFEPYVEELKKGDLAIFWDNYRRNTLIRLYDTKRRNMHLDNNGTAWDNTIKWDGTKEQFEKVLRREIN